MSSWEDEFDLYTCPICQSEDCVPAYGLKKSPILIMGAFPGKDEVRKGRPFVGGSGSLFRKELRYVGIDMKRLRLCNLWLHPKNKNQECLNYSAEKAIAEAKNKKFVLLVGADTVKYFTGMGVTDTNGLVLEADYISAPVMSIIQPANVFKKGGVVGELRFALQQFAINVEDLL